MTSHAAATAPRTRGDESRPVMLVLLRLGVYLFAAGAALGDESDVLFMMKLPERKT